MTAVRKRGEGVPVSASPIPLIAACTTAVTTTPSATLRIALAARSATSSPRAPASRRQIHLPHGLGPFRNFVHVRNDGTDGNGTREDNDQKNGPDHHNDRQNPP